MYFIDRYYDHYVIKRKEDNGIVFHYDNFTEAEKELKELIGNTESQGVVKNNGQNYIVYHLHSDLSNGVTNIDSVTKYKEYVEYAKSLGMTALAFAEHGNIFEWVHKKEAIEAAGMKYIHAAEVYLTDNNNANNIVYSAIDLFSSAQTKKDIRIKIKDYYQREDGAWIATVDDEKHPNYGKMTLIDIDSLEKECVKHRDNYHCVLIAKNHDGVKELNKLISSSFNRNDYHYYYAPRIGFNELYATSDNIIVTTACLDGVINKADNVLKTEFLKFLIKNKHRCYLEVQHHNCVDQANYNKILYAIHQKTGIPLIAGTDTHCLNDTHIEGRSILQKAKNVFFSDEESWDLTFKTYDELVEAYRNQNALSEEVYLQAIENTNVMADSIEEFKLDYSKKYPKLYSDSEKALKEKIVKGIKNRGVDKYDNFDEYKKKIQYELETYKYNGAIDFLLLEEDYKSELKRQGVSYGYSRGSVSGSIIAYLLGITEVDSIKYNLNFERFMNKERVSLADVDTDWSKKDRYKVREYLFNKEGLYCCDIITFNTIALKGAIKDVGRALGLSVDETQTISDAVYQDENKKDCIDDFYIKKYPELFKYVDIVKGTIVSIGNHPAGLVVSPFPIDEWFGLCTTKTNENMISQINMKELDGLQFVKLDVLGLDCVGLINETCDLAGIPRITPDNISFDDKKVWDEIRDDCTMIFQFESSYAGDYIKQLLSEETIAKIKEKNENFSYIDLMSMANGAIRPAGASYRDELSTGKYHDNGHEALNKFLAPTLGYLVYQEQIIEFLHSFCGYTMGEADIVRRGFAKKTGTDKFIPKIKEGFIKTMKEKYNVDEDESNSLIESFIQVIIDASSYLFSLNHATPYSFLGYVVGWLRCYYKLETVTTALNIYEGDSDKCLEILQYARKHNIELKPIRFGKSGSFYTIDKENNAIYKGISSIKYCNAQIANELLELSKNKYGSFIDLLKDIKEKTSLNSRQLDILIRLNFFSDFGNNKYLLSMNEIYDKFANAKIIAKKKMEELGVTEYIMTKYSGKETPSQYRDIDNDGLIKELCRQINNESLGIVEQISSEVEFLGYANYTNKDISEHYYIVTNFDDSKNTTRPYCTLYRIHDGEKIDTRVSRSNVFKTNPFGLFSIINMPTTTYEYKKVKDGDKWVDSEEMRVVLSEYEVIK